MDVRRIPGELMARFLRHRHATAVAVARWVPIRALAERHRPRIAAHLLALGTADRYLRFGYAASDEQIVLYVERLRFDRDEIFGVFNRRLDIIAMSHLAYADTISPAQPDTPPAPAEFGVSVSSHARGRGYGRQLFERAVLHARNRGIDKLIIHALSENTAMLHIVRGAGATIERSGSESEAHLKLPPEDMSSRMGAMMEGRAAEFDYRLKLNARRVDDWLHALGDVKSGVGATRQTGLE